jgi:hypothetical protein
MPAAGRQNVNTDKIMSDRVPGICTMESKVQAINWVHQPQQVAHTGSRPDQQPPEYRTSLTSDIGHSTAVPTLIKICPMLKVDRPCHRAAVTSQFGPHSDMSRPLLLRCTALICYTDP